MSSDEQLSVILLPLQQRPLLLPVSCVAEVLGYQRPEESAIDEQWCLGDIRWRGLHIPLVSFELFNEGRYTKFSANNRIAVMHRTTTHNAMPFYAMVIQGTPKPLSLRHTELHRSNEQGGPAEKVRAILKDIPVSLPDLALLEMALEEQVSLLAS